MIRKAAILACTLTKPVIGDNIGYHDTKPISALEEDTQNVRRRKNQSLSYSLLSSPSHKSSIHKTDDASSTSTQFTNVKSNNKKNSNQSRIITEIQISRNEFILQCKQYLTSETVLANNLISQDDIASFLVGLSKNLGHCESDCDLSFHNLPSDLQLTFIWKLCPQDFESSEFHHCLYEIDLKDEEGELFGFDVNKSNQQELEDLLDDFCYLIYPFSVDYHGGTEAPTNKPRSRPITLPSETPSQYPSIIPTSASDQHNYRPMAIDNIFGRYRSGFLGMRTSMAEAQSEIFIAEVESDTQKLAILKYNMVTKQTNDTGILLNYEGRMVQLGSSRDGKFVIASYKYFKPWENEGEVVVFRESSLIYNEFSQLGLFRALDYNNEDNFGLAVDIADGGQTIMIASSSRVRMFYYNERQWKERKQIPWLSDSRTISDASMTSDAKVVAISQSKPVNLVRLYRWNADKKDWFDEGSTPLLDESLASHPLRPIKVVKNGEMLFAGIPDAYDERGAIFAFEKKKNNAWQITRESKEGKWLIIGDTISERMGRDLSVSWTGNVVAWASDTEAGFIKWDVDDNEWFGNIVLTTGKKPTVSFDPDGEHLAVGLPFKSHTKQKAGKMLLFKWDNAV